MRLEKVGIERSEHGISVRFRARPSGLRAMLGSLEWTSLLVPPVAAMGCFAVLSALHDEAGIGPDFAIRAVLTLALGFGLYLGLRLLFDRAGDEPRVELALRRGTFSADLDGHRIEAPLDQVRLNLGNGVLTLSHPADTELIRPLQPEGIRPFVDEVHQLQAAHGDRSQVPEALRRRPE